MRISTSLKYEVGVGEFARMQSDRLNLYEQISSGKRVVRPGDDPLAASQAQTVSQAQGLNARYGANRTTATQALGMSDNALKSANDVLEAVGGLLVQSGNGGLSNADMKSLAAELKSDYGLLLNQANATDGNSQYLFSGNKGDTPPYATDSDGWGGAYQGDQGQRLVQVNQTRQLATGDSADKIFGDVFSQLKDVIDAMNNYDDADPASVSAFQTALSTVQQGVTATQNQLLTVRASVGARMNEISALDAVGSTRDLSYTQQTEGLVGLDEYAAYSKISYYETALQASMLAFQKLQDSSLLNYVK